MIFGVFFGGTLTGVGREAKNDSMFLLPVLRSIFKTISFIAHQRYSLRFRLLWASEVWFAGALRRDERGACWLLVNLRVAYSLRQFPYRLRYLIERQCNVQSRASNSYPEQHGRMH